MTGFSFKSIVLQIIQGCIVLLPISLITIDLSFIVEGLSNAVSLYTAILLGGSFVIGVLIDFLADTLETLIIKRKWIKSPSYYLLKNGSIWGIRLAHYIKIREDLVSTAKQFAKPLDPETDFCFVDFHNLIFQTAKNKAFKDCSDYQKEHLESFFILYVFCRNLALSILISFILIVWFYLGNITSISCLIFIGIILTAVVCILASYRYFIYYTRMVLGSTFSP